MYYSENKDYDGTYEAFGGFGNDEYGAAGTIYHHRKISNNTTNKTLIVSNNGHSPQTGKVNQV